MLAHYFWTAILFPIAAIAWIIKQIAGETVMEKFFSALDRLLPFSD